jgi:hypothetical protein
MEVATRRMPTLLNVTGEIAAGKVDEEAGIPYSYSCPEQRRHIHHNNDAD